MLIKRIRKVSPKTAFIFETNNDSYRKVRKRKYVQHPNGEVARKAFFMLADKHKAGVWDKFSIMGGLGSMAKWEKADLAKKDKVHFKTAGYQLLGDMFYKALMQAYFDHIANLPAEAPVVVKAEPAPASTLPSKQAASIQPITTSTSRPLAVQPSAKATVAAPATTAAPAKAAAAAPAKAAQPAPAASIAKADVPITKVLKQASKNTPQQIQIPLKPQNTESTATKAQDK